MMMMVEPEQTSQLESPSFNGYSSTRHAQIAARVVDEHDNDVVSNSPVNTDDTEQKQQILGEKAQEEKSKEVDGPDSNDHDDSEFEFSVLTRNGDNDTFSVSADELFQSGRIRPIFPLFNADSIYGTADWKLNRKNEAVSASASARVSDPAVRRLPLKKLLMMEMEEEEADEIRSLPPGTYCIWTPKNDRKSMRKKSGSIGSSSRRWKIPEIFRWNGGEEAAAGSVEETEKRMPVVDAAVDGRKSYDSRRRRDLVGFFGHVNGLTRAIQPF